MAGSFSVSTRDRALFLVHLNKKAGGDPSAKLDLYATGHEIGLTPNQSRVLAIYLRDHGLVQVDLHTGGGYVQIKTTGVEEAAKLQMPFWRRWLMERTVIVAIIVGVIGAIISSIITSVVTPIVSEFLKRML